MSLKEKFKNLITPDDDYEYGMGEDSDYIELEQEEYSALSDYEQPRTKGGVQLPQDTKMILFEPRSFEESEEVARFLKEKKAAVVNLHRLQRDYAQRTIDFLTGVVFALDGSIQKIGHNVILCTPKSIPVAGEISMSIEDLDV